MSVSYSQWIDYLFWKADGAGTPLSGSFELTARCNLDCKMCYIHKRANDTVVRKKELTAGEWLDLAAAAQKQGMLLLLLTGGEPLLRPDFREIYAGCRKLGLLISINTNGTLMTDEMVAFLAKDPPQRVNLTLYGASPETYERLCGDPGACARAYHAVEQLRQAEVPVKLNYSMTPLNDKDVSAVYAFAKAHDLLIQTATYMFPPVRACETGPCAIRRLTPEEAGKARFEYDRYRFEEEELEKRLERILTGQRIEDPDSECQELPTERIRCRAGSTTFWMTYDGQMRPCGMMQVPTVDARTAGFDAAWAQIRREREEIMLPAKCTACQWKNICEFCPAACYAENGRFETVPEYLCQKTHAYLRCGQEWLSGKSGQKKAEETPGRKSGIRQK